MSEVFEIAMIALFGASWPMNVLKSTKWKSIAFLTMIFTGYIFGIISKIIAPSFKWYVMFFYVLNLIMVGTDIVLYIINYRRERKQHE